MKSEAPRVHTSSRRQALLGLAAAAGAAAGAKLLAPGRAAAADSNLLFHTDAGDGESVNTAATTTSLSADVDGGVTFAAQNTSNSGSRVGVHGFINPGGSGSRSASPAATGVVGESRSTSTNTTGVRGATTAASTGVGVWGASSGLTGRGVFGEASGGPGATGVHGKSTGKAVFGEATAADAIGVHGKANPAGTGAGAGVLAEGSGAIPALRVTGISSFSSTATFAASGGALAADIPNAGSGTGISVTSTSGRSFSGKTASGIVVDAEASAAGRAIVARNVGGGVALEVSGDSEFTGLASFTSPIFDMEGFVRITGGSGELRGLLVSAASSSPAAAAQVITMRQRSGQGGVLAGDQLLDVIVVGDAGSSIAEAVRIQVEVAEDWSASAQGARMSFATVRSGESALTERLRFEDTGAVVLPAGSPLQVTGDATVAGALTAGALTADTLAGDGLAITDLDATALTGTVDDGRLSTNIPRLDAPRNGFKGTVRAQRFGGRGTAAPAFTSSGRAVIRRGADVVTVDHPSATPSTTILVTLQSDPGDGIAVQHVVKRRRSFDIVLTGRPRSGRRWGS